MNTITFAGRPLTVGKILCVGRNYVEHISELGNEIPEDMVVFSKPNSAISTRLAASHQGEPLHFEGEICFVVEGGRFAGVGFGLDLTKRATQNRLKGKGLPWERAKAFNGAALFSSFAPIDSPDDELQISLFINETLQQRGSTTQMLYSPQTIFNELCSFTTLSDGDIVMTGTPAGVGIVHSGSLFHGQIHQGEKLLAEGKWTALDE